MQFYGPKDPSTIHRRMIPNHAGNCVDSTTTELFAVAYLRIGKCVATPGQYDLNCSILYLVDRLHKSTNNPIPASDDRYPLHQLALSDLDQLLTLTQ